MNSTMRFAGKPKNDIQSPFESRVPTELASPTHATGPQRRSTHRWADQATATENPSEGTSKPARDPHPIESLVSSLLEPKDDEQRIQEYDWYIRYPTTDLSSQTLGEEKDLKLYIRAARLAEGEEVEGLLAKGFDGTGTGTGAGAVGIGAGGQAGEEVLKDRGAFYEAWLKG